MEKVKAITDTINELIRKYDKGEELDVDIVLKIITKYA